MRTRALPRSSGRGPDPGPVHLRVTVTPQAVAASATAPAADVPAARRAFVARPGRWIGAKVGVFGRSRAKRTAIRFPLEPFEPRRTASLIVAQDGSGDFRTIQEAVDAIPDRQRRQPDHPHPQRRYREKVMIAKSYVSLVGEDREKTRIEFAELRRNWRAEHPDD